MSPFKILNGVLSVSAVHNALSVSGCCARDDKARPNVMIGHRQLPDVTLRMGHSAATDKAAPTNHSCLVPAGSGDGGGYELRPATDVYPALVPASEITSVKGAPWISPTRAQSSAWRPTTPRDGCSSSPSLLALFGVTGQSSGTAP